MMKVASLILVACIISSCNFDGLISSDEKVKIGFSQAMSDDLWRMTMNEELIRVSAVYPEIELEIRDGKSSNEKQINDIEYFIEEGVDVLIVSPIESDPITPIVEKAFNRGIPVILIDRKINSDKFTTYIGGDNYEIGRQAGIYSKYLLNNQGTILEITGLKGSSPAQERHKGFIDQFTDTDIKIIEGGDGQWIESPTRAIASEWYGKNGKVDLVFAHNDVMAVATYDIAESMGYSDSTYFIGVDALAGEFGGVKKVMDGILDATLLYSTGGKEAIEVARKISIGEQVPTNITLKTALINEDNAEIYLLQTEKISEQQELIERQQGAIDRQVIKVESQQNWIITIVVVLAIVFVILFYLFRAYKYIGRINRHLEQKNASISRQKDEIEKMSERIEKFNKEKIDFFTFISHEFRTPITIMLSLMYRVKSFKKGISGAQLDILQKNISRLDNLVEQVLDFRKFEEKKIDVKNEAINLKEFLPSLISGFGQIENKILGYEIDFDVSPVILFDRDKLEKILSNLLSNAVKFTNDDGKIKVIIEVENNQLLLKVADNGVGIKKELYEEVFKPFFSTAGENSRYYARGTGIGLNLVKQIVELYHGTIRVDSEEGIGTTFICRFPITILEDIDTFDALPAKELVVEENETTRNNLIIANRGKVPQNKGPKVLLVEDDKDLNFELQELFKEHDFNVTSAFDGSELKNVVSQVKPEIVVTDLVMPNVSGLEVARMIKKDPDLADIPVLMLTAMTDMEMKKKGYEAGVDDYITKPFPPNLLIAKVENVLSTRKKFKQSIELQYSNWFKGDIEELSNEDKQFISKLTKKIEERISDFDLNVNDLADRMNMSRVTLYNKVKQLLNITPVELIKSYRLSYAKTLIEETDFSISEIAFKCGFQNSSYFSKVFKSTFNITPTDFASNHRKLPIN